MSTRHYLDHASSAPLRPEAKQAITEFVQTSLHGDPGRPYSEGRIASAVIEEARDNLAQLLNVNEREVIFTSSGTEAANFANYAARRGAGKERAIVCSGVEHAGVRLAAERDGPVELLAVDAQGHIDLDELDRLLVARPALVHCQYVNHEVGTRQRVREVIAACHSAGVAVHVDACSAIGQFPVDLSELGADFVSLSAHKFGGPTGIGALILARGRRVQPFVLGGDQERARRAGMEHALGIVALGAVAKALSSNDVLVSYEARARELTARLLQSALAVPGVVAFGDTVERAPHIVCLGVSGVEAEPVVLGLDQAGIAVHSGSACSSEAFEPSPVLLAMGVDAEHSLRLSVGWSSTDEDIVAFEEHFAKVVGSLRELGS